MESSTDAIIALDQDRRFISCNQAFLKLFGYDLDQVLGQTTEMIHTSSESYQRFGRLAYPAVAEQGYWMAEWDFRRGDGTVLPMETITSVRRDGKGELAGFVAVLRDISQRKSLESQLHQAQKMEAIGTLAGGVAHDFNNLLSVIMGYSELCLDDMDPGDPRCEQLEQVMAAAGRGKDLVRQILTFSRRMEAETRPLDLGRQVEHAAQLLARTLPRMINIELNLSAGLPPISANAVQMEQVVMNLATNAQDAMPGGGTLLLATDRAMVRGERCSACGSEIDGDYLRLTVSDTGEGMDQATLAHVFEPFYTTKELGRGTGLGLSSVFGIVKGHGGHIICRSAPGGGTTFICLFPVGLEADEPQTRGKGSDDGPVGSGERILVVDDDPEIRDISTRILRAKGFKVKAVDSGEQALDVLLGGRLGFDLVVLDLNMPGMGGLACLRVLSREMPGQKVVVASALLPDEQKKRVLAAGALDFLEKPYQKADLHAVVAEALGLAGKGRLPHGKN